MSLFLKSSKHRAARRGLTLLELLLALGLAALVFVAVAMAIDIHLRTLDAGRSETEEAQLARAVLRRISDDIRGAVQHQVIDFSTLQGISPDLAAGLGNLQSEDDFVGTALGQAGGSSSGGSTGGSSSSSRSSSSSSRSTSGGSASRSGGSGSTGAGASAAGGSASAGGASATSGATGAAEAGSSASQDIAESATPAPSPGIYGNQYELQIDVSRLPRPDEFNGVLKMTAETSLMQLPSDIKTVSYFVRPPATVEKQGSMTQGGFSDEAQGGGLVRREIDRAAALRASDLGDTTLTEDSDDVIAPEVTGLEFSYFDGSQWVTEWDSDSMGGLPVAIEIALAITPLRFLQDRQEESAFGGSAAEDEVFSGEKVYRIVVRLPAAKPIPPADETDSATASQTGTSSSSAAQQGTSP